jgi:hypothetical protein
MKRIGLFIGIVLVFAGLALVWLMDRLQPIAAHFTGIYHHLFTEEIPG